MRHVTCPACERCDLAGKHIRKLALEKIAAQPEPAAWQVCGVGVEHHKLIAGDEANHICEVIRAVEACAQARARLRQMAARLPMPALA